MNDQRSPTHQLRQCGLDFRQSLAEMPSGQPNSRNFDENGFDPRSNHL